MVFKFIPDSILIGKIQIQNAYSDNISFEKKTGKKHTKYKLALCKILDVFFFSKLTTNEKSCDQRFTVKIFKKDWDDWDDSYLYAESSFCDVTKFDVLNEVEILIRTEDGNNIAEVCENIESHKIGRFTRALRWLKNLGK